LPCEGGVLKTPIFIKIFFMKYLVLIAIAFSFCLQGCKKKKETNENIPRKDTTIIIPKDTTIIVIPKDTIIVPPKDTTFGKERLFNTWDLRSRNVIYYKNGYYVSSTSQGYADGSLILVFKKIDSLIVKLHDTLFDAKFTVSKNVIFTNPKIFNDLLLDSMTFQFDTYKLILTTEERSVDGSNDTHKVVKTYLLTP
jgi:hypothetical protein